MASVRHDGTLTHIGLGVTIRLGRCRYQMVDARRIAVGLVGAVAINGTAIGR
jgi:hypothetical protein